MKLLLPDIYQARTRRLQTFLFTVLCSLVTTFSYAQFDFATETEPNNLTNDSGVQTLTVATTNTTTIIGGSTVVGSDEDYWKIGKSPFVSGNVAMAVQSNSGSQQPQVWLERRTGSYDGPLVSNTLIHPGTDQSNRAMNLTYTAADDYYLIRLGGNRSGGYSYRANFPGCNIPGLTTILSTDRNENDFTITSLAGSTNISLIKVNTTNNFTDPSSGYTYPTATTATNVAYSGSGEQTVYTGNSTTPNITISGLTANTTYYVKVFNYSDCGGNLQLNAGNVFTVTTCGATPATATTLNLTANNQNSSFISSFTGATGAAIRYVVKANTSNSFTAPANGTTFPTANAIYGGGEQVVYAGDSATPNELITGLTTGTEYFFKVYTAELCGGNYYFESTGVFSSITPICSPPNSNTGIYLYAEPTNLHNSIDVINFTGNNNADGKIMYISDENSFTFPTTLPVASLPTTSTDYSGKTGQTAIYTGAATGFRVTTTGLSPNTTYYYAAVNYKECNGVLYFFPTGIYSQQTTCGVTSALASSAVMNNVDTTTMDLESFTAPTATVNAPDGYVIKMNTINSFTPLAIGATASTGNTVYAGGEQVIYSGTSVSPNLNITGLTEGTQYFFTVYAYKDCNGTTIYQQTGYTFSQFTLGLNFTPPVVRYNDPATTLNATTTSTGAIAYSLINDTTGATLVDNDFTPGAIGSTTVRVSVATDGIYNTISKEYTLTIVKANPALSWNAPSSIAEGVPLDASFLNATANIAGTFEYYTFYNSFTNTYSGRITEGVTSLPYNGGFPTTIYTRFIPNDINYNVAVGSTSITVTSSNTGVIEITAVDAIKALGSSDPALISALTSGQLTPGDKIWVPLTREPGETAGTYVISVDQTAQAPASFDPLGVCPTGVCIGRLDFFGSSEIVSSTTGNYTIQLQTGTFTITNKEQVTITLDRFDLYNTFYSANPRQAVDISSVVLTSDGSPVSPTINVSYSGNDFFGNSYGPSATPPTNAGNYTVTATVDAADPNYFGSVTGNFSINQYQIGITPDTPQSKAYDGSPKTFEATATGLSGENIPLRISYQIGPYYSEAAPIEIGSYPVSVNATGTGNYSIFYSGGTLIITDKTEVTIALADLTQQFDGSPKPVTVSSIETSPGVAATPTPTINITYEGINGTSYSKRTTPPTFGGEYKVFAYVDTADPNFYGSTSGTLTIFEKEFVTFNFGSGSLTYNGNPQGVTITSLTDSNDDVITPVPAYSISYDGEDFEGNTYGPSSTPPTNAGDYTIAVAIDAANPTYQGSDSYEFTIGRRAIEVTADAQSKAYGGVDPALTYQITTGSLLGGDVFTGNLTRTTGEDVGTYTINQGILDNSNYAITYVSNTLEITKANQAITFGTLTDVTYGDADFDLTATSDSGLTVSYVSSNTSVATVTGNTVTIVGAGSTTITASQAGDTNVNAATDVPQILVVTKKELAVTPNVTSIEYGYIIDQTGTVPLNVTGFVNGDDINTLTPSGLNYRVNFYEGTFTGTALNIGMYANGARVFGSPGPYNSHSNYTYVYPYVPLEIVPREVTVTADANQTRQYGDIDPTLAYTLTPLPTTTGTNLYDFSSFELSGSLARVAGENVGTYAINQGTLDATTANYNLNFVSDNFEITARSIEITADAQSKTYGDADPTFTYRITNGSLAGSDAIIGILERVTGENAGTYAIDQGTLGINSNYAISFVSDDLTITARAIEVTAEAQTKIYGDADPALTYQITNGSLAFSDTFTGALARAAGQARGNYTINQGTLSLGANYDLTFVPGNLYIDFRFIRVIPAAAIQKVYGDPDPDLTWPHIITQGSLAFDDTLETYGTFRISGENIGRYRIGGLSARFTSSNGGQSSYAITYTSSGSVSLDITARAIEVTADAQSKAYGDADPTLSYQITNGALQFSDAFTGTLSRATGENVGTYAINQGTLSAGRNYILTYVGDDLTIGQRAIEVTADALNKEYGDVDPALTYQITNGSLAFSDAFTGNLTRVAGETLGNYAINQGTLALDGNYNLTYISNDLTIGRRTIEITAYAKTKIYGDADPALTYQITSGSLVVGDAFTGSLTRVTGENAGNYAIQQGSVALNANYTLNFVSNDLGITARSLEITADSKAKIYGDVDPALTYQITNGALQFGDALSGNLSRVTGEDVGNYAIQQGTVTAGGNYNISFVSNDLTIGQRAVEITADPASKIFGTTDPVLTYQLTAGVLQFGDTFSGSLSRAVGEDVGGYTIQLGSVTAGNNYALSFVDNTFTITQASQAITFGPLANVIFGDPDFNLNAVASSGLAVTYTSSNPSVATISGNTVTIVGAGTTTITASQSGNGNYTAATDVMQLLTVDKANQTITFDTLDTVVVDGQDFNLNATASSGLTITYTSSDPSVATITGNTVTIIGIGTTTITASQAGDTNWNPANDVQQVLTVVEGCPLADLPIDNFQIQTSSETCADKNNGNILINTVANLDYVATVNNETYNFTSRLLITDLAPGKYPVCIRINGFANCEQCFEMEIDEAPILDGKTTVSNGANNKQVFVEIETGTAPFTVMLNDQFVGEYDSNSFLINAQNGDKIEVTSSVACEGKLSTTINPFDQMSVFPNPTKANVTMALPKFESNSVTVSIHNTLGTMVSSKLYNVVGSRVQLPMENLPAGIYFVTVEDGISQTFKIIKE